MSTVLEAQMSDPVLGNTFDHFGPGMDDVIRYAAAKDVVYLRPGRHHLGDIAPPQLAAELSDDNSALYRLSLYWADVVDHSGVERNSRAAVRQVGVRAFEHRNIGTQLREARAAASPAILPPTIPTRIVLSLARHDLILSVFVTYPAGMRMGEDLTVSLQYLPVPINVKQFAFLE